VLLSALASLNSDSWLLFATRCLRLFAYGFLSVVLLLYLSSVGLSDQQIGVLLTLALLGDTAVSLWITTSADRLGRKRMLLAGALLMVFAGALFAVTRDFWLLVIAATIGVISPSGKEVGPFLSIEQAALSHVVPDKRRTEVFAWYNLAGSFAAALGAFCGGAVTQGIENAGAIGVAIYRPAVIAYAVFGLLLAVVFLFLSPAIEIRNSARQGTLGLHRSRGVVLRLSALFALDAFGGGFIMDSIVAYWLHLRFGAEPIELGSIFFGANLFGGFSGLAAAWLARRFGLINTMVFTHLPSNILLLLVPLMPTLPLAITVLLLRFSISQMDVPTRQSYTMAVVAPDERSAASGVTAVARSLGAGCSPLLVGAMLGNPALMSMPFFLAGGLKIAYDLLLYRAFVKHQPAEETAPGSE
jgi:predicted MFS family arabinose efflux permease